MRAKTVEKIRARDLTRIVYPIGFGISISWNTENEKVPTDIGERLSGAPVVGNEVARKISRIVHSINKRCSSGGDVELRETFLLVKKAMITIAICVVANKQSFVIQTIGGGVSS